VKGLTSRTIDAGIEGIAMLKTVPGRRHGSYCLLANRPIMGVRRIGLRSKAKRIGKMCRFTPYSLQR